MLRKTLLCTTVLLAGCGSSGSDDNAVLYAFVRPSVNALRVYQQTITDNSGNTISLSYTETVTAVNSDGSYTVAQEDPSHQTVVVNGVTYGIATATIAVSASGQTLSTTTQATPPLICTFVPHGPGPDFPVQVGTSWNLSYTLDCSPQAAVAYTQSGVVADVETVTVPAGTFAALKLVSTVTFTDAHGTRHTQTLTHWRDIATSVSLKETIATELSGGTPPSAYPVSTEIVLQSQG